MSTEILSGDPAAIELEIDRRASELFERRRSEVGCDGCGLSYGSDWWIEAIVPDDIWAQISPTKDSGGLLCIGCIARRLRTLGLTDVPVMLCGTEPLRAASQQEAFNRGWQAAVSRIEELETEVTRLTGQREDLLNVARTLASAILPLEAMLERKTTRDHMRPGHIQLLQAALALSRRISTP